MSETAPVIGSCDPRFAAVRDAFAGNFAERGDVGAGVAVFVDGRLVVDLTGGWADAARSRPWRADTLVNVFSVGKALAALSMLMRVEAGALDLDTPVAAVWPEFGAAGKSRVTLRQILSHQAGLPSIREPLEDGAMLDAARMAGALAAQAPWWPPGEAHGYHVNTYGWLVGETFRRVSDGETLGRFLARSVSSPADADVHIGLSDGEHARVAEFIWPAANLEPSQPGGAEEETLMRRNAYSNPPGISGGLGWINTPAWRRAEIPSTNGHGSALGVARIYARLASGGYLSRALLAEATREASNGEDRVLGRPSRFGLGFQLTQAERPIGPNPRVFGHFGAGGALGFADPDAGVAFGYVCNQMGPRWRNPKNQALIDALYGAL